MQNFTEEDVSPGLGVVGVLNEEGEVRMVDMEGALLDVSRTTSRGAPLWFYNLPDGRVVKCRRKRCRKVECTHSVPQGQRCDFFHLSWFFENVDADASRKADHSDKREKRGREERAGIRFVMCRPYSSVKQASSSCESSLMQWLSSPSDPPPSSDTVSLPA